MHTNCVNNYTEYLIQARNHMCDMKVGDKAFFYHSNCKKPGIAGIVEVSNPWADMCIKSSTLYGENEKHGQICKVYSPFFF